MALCEFLSEEETQWALPTYRGNILPTRLSVVSDPKLPESPGYVALGTVANARVYAQIMNTEESHPVPPFKVNAERVWKAWEQGLARVLGEETPIQEILDEVQATVEELLKARYG